ncbi:MAG: AsmA family protein [Acidobacteriaceae bacterium]|nr:AsmA family protein [Acidobacteriaceae bacterium]
MSRVFTRRRVLIGIVLLLVLFFVPPFIRLSKYSQGRVVQALSNALDRPVTVRSVSLQLLPRPGLVFEDFVVQEDPAFGAEPMLRAHEVTALPRLSSLWRARLEIGTLKLREASLNLVRTPDGQWNVKALLNRATHTPTAPTSKIRPEARPRFPYIEATHGRINFKSGPEKMVWAFSEADFALWLESENLWNMRLEANPVRTDANLSDTGTVRVSGSFRRTENLRDTALNVHLVLDRAQLGQLTRLVQGRDRGWRGAVYLNATLAGTPAALNVTSDLSIDDFRRYDIMSDEGFRVSSHCQGQYQLAVHGFSAIDCRIPEGGGQVIVRGSVADILTSRTYDLAIATERVPISDLVRLLRHAKRGVPDDLHATGIFNAQLSVHKKDTGGPNWTGGGAAEDITLDSRALTPAVTIDRIAFARFDAAPSPHGLAARNAARFARTKSAAGMLSGWTVGPFAVPLGGTAPVVMKANLSREGYSAQLKGESDLGRMLALVRSVGGRAPQLTANGMSSVDVAMLGKWSGFAVPQSTGTMQLRNVEIKVGGINAPVHFSSAEVGLTPETVNITAISASFEGSRARWQGETSYPRSCTGGELCPIRVDLHADELSTDDLNRIFNPNAVRKWYQLGGSASSAFGGLAISGRLTADRFAIKSVQAENVAAQVNLESGKLRLSDFRADVLGGSMRADWQANFAADPPVYSGTGQLDRAGMSQIGHLLEQAHAAGTLSATFKLRCFGWSQSELLSSAAATLEFTWAGGTLRSAAFDPSMPALQMTLLTAQGEWRKGRLELTAGRMETPVGIYQITGTAGRQLDLKLRSNNARAYLVSGTLDEPRVAAVPASETQASLKP